MGGWGGERGGKEGYCLLNIKPEKKLKKMKKKHVRKLLKEVCVALLVLLKPMSLNGGSVLNAHVRK